MTMLLFRRVALTLSVAIVALAGTSVATAVLLVEDAAPPPTELFFSEYVEGSSFNKAVEIYNGTGAAINLGDLGYKVQLYSNGSTTVTSEANLTGTIANGGVYVLAHTSAALGGFTPDARSGTVNFNGDDAFVLLRGATVVDVIGQIGNDPGTEWGTGLTSTADNTLRRKPTVTAGDTNGADAFDPAAQWDGSAADTFDGLGSHTVEPPGSTDAAPTFVSSTPSGGASGVAVASNITITFSEPVTPSSTAFTVSCASTGAHSVTVTDGPTTFTLNPDADFGAGETCTVTVTGAQVSDVDTDDPPDTMASNHQFSFTTATPAIEIHQVQGAGHISPYLGQAVTLQPGVVTAVRSNGFFLQDPTPDANVATSDAIFVFTSSAPRVLQGETTRPIVAGDELSVTGNVTEFRGGGATGPNLSLTQITSPSIAVAADDLPPVSVTVIGNGGRVPPTNVIDDDANGSVETGGSFDPTTDGIDFYESLEAMLVQVNDAVVVGPTNNFGELWALPDNGANASLRTARGGIVVRPGDFNPERIQLDDVIADTPDANVNDRIPGQTTGVLNYDFGNFELLITSPALVVPGGLAREVTATNGAFELSVATFNVENLDPRDPASKFADLAGLIVNNLKSPDVIGLEEVQDNNGPTNDAETDASLTLTVLADAIVAAGGPRYSFRQINPVDDQDGGEPGGNIRVAFLFRTDRGVQFVDRPGGSPTASTGVVAAPGGGAQLTASPGRVAPTNSAWNSSRKPLVGEFLFRGEKFFITVNHFNSKGGDQPLFGRFQPPTQTTQAQRIQQAQLLRDFMNQILAIDPKANIIALGDFNDFEFSRPLEILKGSTMHDLIESLPPNERYGYVFEGNSQTLDHILVSSNIFGNTPFVYDVVHVNAEFADQTSDHDPSVVRLLDQARVGLTKTASADSVTVGGVVSYTLRVVNNGPKPAADVVLTDPLPAGAQLIGVTPSQGSCQVTTTVTCALGTLANGAAATVVIDVRTTQEGTLENAADVRAAQPDPAMGDNNARATTRVERVPLLPPERCRVRGAPKSLVVGRRVVLRLQVESLATRRPLGEVKLRLRGAGISRAVTTGEGGTARVALRPTRAGVLRVAAERSPGCVATVSVRRAPRGTGTAGLTGRP
jgi:uncharacterized repeat protein (TIGR01451 family)